MYRERLEEVINELDDIIYQVRRGVIDPATLQGTNLTTANCEFAAEDIESACILVMKFIENHLSE